MQSVDMDSRPCDEQVRLWIDTDITIGTCGKLMAFRDVDDGYAIGALFRSQEVDIVGLSSTRGNTEDINLSTDIAKSFVKKFGPVSLQVSEGASENFNTCQTIPKAVEDLANELRNGPLTILAIGALTNIALLIKHFPDTIENITQVISVAGRRHTNDHFISGSHQPKPFRDLNFEFDVPAFKQVLETNIELTLVPFEVCKQMWVDFSALEQLALHSGLSRYLAEHSLGWYSEWKLVFGSKNGFNPFDMVAAAFAINSEWFTAKRWNAEVVEAASDTSKGEQKPYLICNEEVTNHRPVNYLVEVQPKVQDILLQRLAENDIGSFVLGLSHINVIVDDVVEAANYYQRVLGFEAAFDEQGNKMEYLGVSMAEFNQDAGLAGQDVNVDVKFVKHPYAKLYIELMTYHQPVGKQTLPEQPKTYDFGGPRHIALEVSNCNQVFNYLKSQPDAKLIDPRPDYHPEKLAGFPITFFYWIDKYGVQWEMEEGRRVGTSRGIV
ncbi:nucleoside hydrolase [Vibrio paucivorans]